MIGDSIFMQRLNESIRRAARTRMNVLIIGETGTGKELVARAIHDLSPRSAGRFVDVNCAAVQEDLFESEFFGHERGAFTGALERRIGKFELADKGSLFLDELGEMSMAMQAKLLRVLETREIERVGGRTKIPVDVRIVAATNRDLPAAIAAGTFREDFYFRLQTKIIETTPLREHREDIPALVRYFLGQTQDEVDRLVTRISEEAMAALEKYHWPGNVRQLRSVILAAASEAASDVVELGDLQRDIFERPAPEVLSLRAAVNELERSLIATALDRVQGNRKLAAEVLDVTSRTMRRKMRELDVHYPRGL